MKKAIVVLLAAVMFGCAGHPSANVPVIHAVSGETLKQLIDSLPPTGGVVEMGLGTWVSGYQPGTVISKPNVTIQGAAMPQFNADYTAMVGGTILLGPIGVSTGADYFTVRDLGVDAGQVYINARNGGVPTDALDIFNNGQVIGAPPVESPLIENVSCLGYSPNAQNHCMLVENVNNAYVHNVHIVLNCHGLVLKGTNSKVDGVYSRGHGMDSVIVKSDAYAPASNDTLSNITIGPLVSPGDTKGIVIIGVGAPVSNINVSNVKIQSPLSWGINAQGASAGALARGLTFSDISIDYKGGSLSDEYCMQFVEYVSAVKINNLNCSDMWVGIGPYLPVEGGFYNYVLTKSQFANIASDAVQTYGGDWRIYGNNFESVGGSGIVNFGGLDLVDSNSFVDIGGSDMFAAGGTFATPVTPVPIPSR